MLLITNIFCGQTRNGKQKKIIKRPPYLSAFLLLLFFSSSVFAQQTRYISDELRVPLRKKPCNSCSILHRGLVAGTKITFITMEGDWAQVKTTKGLTGWLPSQYLVSQPIAKDRVEAAEANTRLISKENAELKKQLAELTANHEQSSGELQTLSIDHKKLETELSNIKKISANAIALQEQNEQLIKENRILQSEMDVITAAKDQMDSDNSRKWFLYGCIAVFLSAVLSTILPQLRPRKRFTEWG